VLLAVINKVFIDFVGKYEEIVLNCEFGNGFCSSVVKTFPDGFPGVLIKIAFVFSVTTLSRSSRENVQSGGVMRTYSGTARVETRLMA